MTPQPPRSGYSFSHNTAGASAEYLGGPQQGGVAGVSSSSNNNSGNFPMRRQGTRSKLFSPVAPPSAAAGDTADTQFESAHSPSGAGAGGGGDMSSPERTSRHVGGFNTPQRPGVVSFAGAAAFSPHRGAGGGAWSPGHTLTHLPTIGSEDSWDQNAQYWPSPGAAAPGGADAGAASAQPQQQHNIMGTPVRPLPRVGDMGGVSDPSSWAAASTPVRPAGMRGGQLLGTPRTVPRAPLPPAGAAAMTPRQPAAYRNSQQGGLSMRTPGPYGSRTTGNFLVSGSSVVVQGGAGGAGSGGEGDTVSGVLQLLGDGGAGGLYTQQSAALSGFSSSSNGSLASTPEGPYAMQGGHGGFKGGYFTPVRPNRAAASAAALLPASARPAGRPPLAAAWGTPAAAAGRMGAAAGMSGARNVLPPAAGGQQQVPDTPLLRAGRNIAGVLFSPAPPAPFGAQQQQQQQYQHPQLSTPQHIQSLLPPPGSASKLKLVSNVSQMGAAVSGLGDQPPGPSSVLQHQQSSAAAAAALLQPLSPGSAQSSQLPHTPTVPDNSTTHGGAGAGGAGASDTSSCFNTQPLALSASGGFLQLASGQQLREEDMHTPVHSPRAGLSPAGTPSGASGSGYVHRDVGSSGGLLDSSSAGSVSHRPLSSPPPAPSRPLPGVVLVPAVESLYGSECGEFGAEGFEDAGVVMEGYDSEEGLYTHREEAVY